MELMNGSLKNLDRNAILGAADLPVRPVEVPEWGGQVFVRMLTAGERDAWEASVMASSDKDVRARLAAVCLCDEAGNRLFELEDVILLTRKSGRAMDRIFAAAVKHNAMSREDLAELKKNS